MTAASRTVQTWGIETSVRYVNGSQIPFGDMMKTEN